MGYCRSFCLFTLLLVITSCGKKVKIEHTTTLSHYSSGSAIEYLNGNLYLVGDDMAYVLVMDSAFNAIDTIPVIDSTQSPIPKKIKPDLEAATTVRHNGADALLLISSGSLDPYRNNAWLIDPVSKHKTTYDLLPFYSRLKAQGLKDLNIEGATAINNLIILSARGNKTNPLNHLIVTSVGFWNEQATAPISIKTVRAGKADGKEFSGVSGLAYSAASDCLVLTVSTENTTNSYDDGTIGKSYLWLVNNISKRLAAAAIEPDKIIDLEAADSRFRGQKIEAACVVHETTAEMKLALSADNDNGKTGLFMVVIQK